MIKKYDIDLRGDDVKVKSRLWFGPWHCILVCASRDHESWQGVASLRDATRKDEEQLTGKSFSIRFSRALPIFFDSVR